MRDAVLFLMAIVGVAGCTRSGNQDYPSALVLDCRLIRTATSNSVSSNPLSEVNQTVSRIRLAAWPDCPTSVYLPAGEHSGCGLVFIPSIVGTNQFVAGKCQFHYEFLGIDEFGESKMFDRRSDAGTSQTFQDPPISYSSEIGTDIKVFDCSLGRGPLFASYVVMIKCDKVVRLTFNNLTAKGDGVFLEASGGVIRTFSNGHEVDGETLMVTNVAVPSLMSSGVQIEPLKVLTLEGK